MILSIRLLIWDWIARFACLIIISGISPAASWSAIVTVNISADEYDGDVSSIADLIASPGGTGISLREALSAANNTAGPDEIQFHTDLNGMVIFLNIGTSNEDLNEDGDLDILDTDGLTITGNGMTNTIIDGNDAERIFHHLAGDLTISGLTIQNGNETMTGDDGGGIYTFLPGEDLYLSLVRITGCDAGGSGGGINWSSQTGSQITITSSFIELNTAGGGGGGGVRIGPTDGLATITSSRIAGNMAVSGGGFDQSMADGVFEMEKCTVSGNIATTYGGGMVINGTPSQSFITMSTISGNTAEDYGGGIALRGSGAALTATNVTISGNRTNGDGAGLVIQSANGQVANFNFVTMTENVADDDNAGGGDGGGINLLGSGHTVNIRNSIIQANMDRSSPATDDCANTGGGTYVTQGGNVFGDGTGCSPGPDDTSDPANLGPLQNNGGSTETHAFFCESAAMDFAVCDTVEVDQTEALRSDGACDSGAFERQLSFENAIAVTTPNDVLDGNILSIDQLLNDPGPDGLISLREAITASNYTIGPNEIRFSSNTNGLPFVLDIGTTNDDYNADGDLDILDCAGLTITGNGMTNTIIDGNDAERIFHHLAGDLTISGLTIQNGNETMTGDDGGGIYTRFPSEDLYLSLVRITGCEAGGSGGGVSWSSQGSQLIIENSFFDLNTAAARGGAVRLGSTDGLAIITGSRIAGNMAVSGGGFDQSMADGVFEMEKCTVSGNIATTYGGGMVINGTPSQSFITMSTISGNTAEDYGGGIALRGSGASLTATNVTISGNRTNGDGAGLVIQSGNGQVANFNFVTMTENVADDDNAGGGDGGGINLLGSGHTVNIRNSIIQANMDRSSPATDDCANTGGGTYVAQGGNVFGDGTGCSPGPDDTSDPANLGPLQNNGGSTETHAIDQTSSAYNFGICSDIDQDQRCYFRIDGSCDSGAFEFGASPDQAIPTISEWGLLLLGLFLLIFGTAAVEQNSSRKASIQIGEG